MTLCGRYSTIKTVTSTITGRIDLAWDNDRSAMVAMKITGDTACEFSLDNPTQEIAMLESLQSGGDHFGKKYIVQMLDKMQSSDQTCLVMEFAPCGDLFDLLDSVESHMSTQTALVYIQQIAEGISYLHQNNVAHMDISLENILVDEQGNIKICDFGLACRVPNREAVRCVGKPAYMAPELANPGLVEDYYDPRSADVYSLGVCLFALLFGFFPYERIGDERFEVLKTYGVNALFGCYGLNPSPPIADLLESMLAPVPYRSTVDMVVAQLSLIQEKFVSHTDTNTVEVLDAGAQALMVIG